jgi:hypothetical protein
MPDLLQRATTGRAKCRGCGRTIEKDELRFGETLPSPYREGESVHWFHLTCAACMRPDKMQGVLRTAEEPIPDRPWLEQAVEFGIAHPKIAELARVERSPSGRAHCQQCHALVEKDAWRVSLHVFQDGRMNPIGSLHVGCAEAYFGTRDIVDRARRLSPDLGDDDAAEIERLLAG